MIKKHLPSLILVATLALCYAITIAPGLSWANGGADGGDLITAAATNGVAHPSGYPLYLLLARVFQFIPLGTLAFRTNLFSAICTILAALALQSFLQRQKILAGAALIAGLAFGLSPAVWSQAVITEVYALQSLLLILFLWGLLDENIRGGNWTRGLLFGLAACNHLTTLLLLPLLFFRDTPLPGLAHPRQFLQRFLSCIFMFFLIYLILWSRAINNAPVNWGNATTPEGFWWQVSGQMYSTYPFDISLADMLLRVRAVGGLLLEQFTILGALVGIYGLFSGQMPRQNLLACCWIFISFSGFAVFYGSYDSQVYLIPTYLAFAVSVAYGIQDILQMMPPKLVNLAVTLILFGLLIRIPWSISTVDASHDQRAEQFGANFVVSIPQNAIIFASDDQPVFALWYFHYALGQRSDVAVIAEELLPYPWYIKTLMHTYPALKISTSEIEMIDENSDHPICHISNENITQAWLCEPTP